MSITLVAGQSGILLDLFTKAGTLLYTPSPYPTYEVLNATSFSQGSGTGFYISQGHFDARNFTVPSSGGTGTWSINWTVGASLRSESFLVEAPSLSDVGVAVTDLEQLIQFVRYDIGDLTETIFNNSQMQIFINKAVQRVNRRLGISVKVRPTGVTPGGIGQPAIIGPITLDFTRGTLFPNNNEIKDIVILQTEVLITQMELSALRRASASAAMAPGIQLFTSVSGIVADTGEGVMVRNADGVVIDTIARTTTWMANRTKLFLEDSASRTKELEEAILRLKWSMGVNSSKVVY